jgi:effector-binding domain-containing protein
MFLDDIKKNAMTIIGRRKPSGERTMAPTPMKAEEVKDKDGNPDARHIAAQELLAAHHEGSPEKMSQALASFIDIHMNKPASPEG